MPLVRHPAFHWLIFEFWRAFSPITGQGTAGGGVSTGEAVTRVTMVTEGGVTLLHTSEDTRGVTQ